LAAPWVKGPGDSGWADWVHVIAFAKETCIAHEYWVDCF